MMDIGSYGKFQPKKILSVSVLESERLCRKWHGADNGRLEYAFSPRFAVTCSEKMMRSAAELAQRVRCLYADTSGREPRGDRKGAQPLHGGARLHRRLRKMRNAHPKTMLGHCMHLSPREIDAIAAAQSSVTHCPTSNFFLGSGLFKLEQLLEGRHTDRSGLRCCSRAGTKHVAGDALGHRHAKGAPHVTNRTLRALRPARRFIWPLTAARARWENRIPSAPSTSEKKRT